jgi:hypothetical protein
MTMVDLGSYKKHEHDDNDKKRMIGREQWIDGQLLVLLKIKKVASAYT